MTNLTSTVPGTFNALYALLAATGATQSPKIPVFHSEVLSGQETENGYVLLGGVENHKFDLAALGSYAFYETYDICGSVSYYQGGPDPLTMIEDVLTQAWSIYQNVVMTTVVENRGANGTFVLGSAAPSSLVWITPDAADYVGGPSEDQGGYDGVVNFRYCLKARITVA